MDHFGWHYYGDTVRRLFLAGGIIMLVTLPLFTNLLPTTTSVSVLIVLVLGFVAGLVSPAHRTVVVINTIVAGIGMFFYEYYAVTGYFLPDGTAYKDLFVFTNQVLAIIFFFALYYSSKSVRGLKR